MPASASATSSSAGLCSSSTGCPTSSSFPLCGGRGLVCGATVQLLGHQGVVARNGNDDTSVTTSAVFVCFLQPPPGQELSDAGPSVGCANGACNSTYAAHCGRTPSTFNGLWVACAQLTLVQPGPPSSAGTSAAAVTGDSPPSPSPPSAGGIISGGGTTGQASSSNTWAVAGGVIGAVAGVVLLAGAAFFAITLVFARRRRSRRAYEEGDATAGNCQTASNATEPVWFQKDMKEGAHHLSELEDSDEGKEAGSIPEFPTAPNSRSHSADQQPSVVRHASVCVAYCPCHLGHTCAWLWPICGCGLLSMPLVFVLPIWMLWYLPPPV